MMGRRTPVVRSDGKRYASITDACHDLLREWGAKHTYAEICGMAGNISRVCNRKPSCNTAYGYGWRYC
jgi:hypothetical protein